MESRFYPKINESVLLRYFTKQLTDREAECVEEWIQASEKNRQIARDVHYILFATTTWSNLRKTSSEKALRRVKRKMLRKRSWLFVKTRFQQTAAILLIILLSSVSIYLLKKDSRQLEWIEVRMNSGMTGTIMLPDGSKVWLNPNTHIKYPSEFAQDRREVELNGEAYFSVERDPNRKFIVHSVEDQVTIEVLGTDFNVDAYKDNGFVSATLISGSIRLSYVNAEKEKRCLLMRPEDKVIYDRVQKSVDMCKTDVERDISWRDGTILLRDTPLDEVLWTLSKCFNVEFEVRGDHLRSCSFTGVFKNMRLDRILEHFKIASHINYSIEQEVGGNGEVLKKRVILY